MATFEGAANLEAQLASLRAQDHADWSLLVSDDGSTDATRAILAEAARREGRIALVDGPGQGSAAANFLSALGPDAPPLPPGACVALSDQDDVWLPHRLSRALALLGAVEGPAIYASRTWLYDARAPRGRRRRLSRGHPRGPSFGNALVQNILAGNTIVMSPEAAAIVRDTVPAARAARAGRGVAHHDWWLYALATGTGMRVLIDEMPGLLYRQHATNVMGAHRGLRRGADRFAMLRDGRYAGWVAGNVEALGTLEERLTPEARRLRARMAAWLAGGAATGGGGGGFAGLRRAGVRRQTLLGDIILGRLVRWGGFGPQVPESGSGSESESASESGGR